MHGWSVQRALLKTALNEELANDGPNGKSELSFRSSSAAGLVRHFAVLHFSLPRVELGTF